MYKSEIISNVIKFCFIGVYTGELKSASIKKYITSMEEIYGLKYREDIKYFSKNLYNPYSIERSYLLNYISEDYDSLSNIRNFKDANTFVNELIEAINIVVNILKEEK